MRLFVAVVPPPEVREAALAAARSLTWSDRVRWLPPQNVHLTLKFLGEAPETEALHATLADAARKHRPFDLALAGAGAFPSEKRARVLWVGVGEGAEPLRSLAGSVEAALGGLGFEREPRPFRPHATVGRCRDAPARLEGREREAGIGPLSFRVESVELVRSRLSPEGAAYTTLAAYPLG